MWYRQDGAKRCWDKAPCIWWTRTIQAQEDEEGQQAEEGNHTKDKQQEEPTSVPEIKDWFDQDWQEFCEACSYDEKTRAYREIAMNVVSDTTKGYLDLNRWTTIPDRLLKGPFDLEKTKLLFWLVRGGARILKQEHNWEVTKLGFEQIMALEDNITLGPYLIYFYHVLGVFDDGHWPDFLLEEKLEWLQAMKLELPVHTHNLLDFRLRLYNFAMNFLGTHQNGRVAAELGRVAAEFEASMTRRQ
ncbi:hypothetical protein B0T21DRAFT_372594 [Apiosordaria backusii]|uniref:Uncharacterized protein n=1 Tax=Apiosordaria backusii TaxID=314023 RepID=A0AA40AXI8_9PEZI|nr:hypothetical protein B0T21DRAFT_372594 [Apiosordaria backusii]